MAGYIALCDHDIGWQELLLSKLDKLGIGAVCTENIDEIENYMDDKAFRKLVVCSTVELNEYIRKCERKGKSGGDIFEKMDIFLISDKREDKEEIDAFRAGCVDFQLRERNIDVILQRIASQFEKKIYKEKIIINIEDMSVEYMDTLITIKDNEAKLLKLLADTDEKYISVDSLCQILWKKSDREARIRLSSLIYRLRKKLPDGGKCIRSIYGKGYYLSKNETQTSV